MAKVLINYLQHKVTLIVLKMIMICKFTLQINRKILMTLLKIVEKLSWIKQ